MNHVDRVRAFLRNYPHDEPTNLDPEIIYTYETLRGGRTSLTWSDLDALCRDAERLQEVEDL